MNNVTLGLSLGGSEIILILVFVVFWLSVVGAIAAAVIWFTRLGKTAGRYAVDRMREGKIPTPPRFRNCPQCGAPLKPDAPEGLCPTCLLKQGIASESGAPAGQPPFIPPTVAELARLFPQMEILEPIGKGGMGAVYKARQPALDRFVALKILAPRAGTDLDFASRFAREARALARLSHPNIVAVYDFGQVQRPVAAPPAAPAAVETPPQSLNYFIMEYVDGPNLRQIEQAGKLSPREALQIIPQICVALQFAHDEGIVHRDIKPENVLLDKKGRVKIADFGLAKILGQEPQDLRLTGARDVMGTPHYMAPEQVEKPQEVDHRADIYSLGVVFYEMLTGELPLGKFQPPSQKVHVDVRLDEVVLRSLAKEPDRRYQHASEVKTDVETIASTPGPAAAALRGAVVDRKPEAPTARRLSQPAIVGACWAGLFFLTVPWWFTPSQVFVPLFAVGVVAPIGTTLLGWLAVSQIGRSAGRVYGLGLAVFDGLLFPLLALDGVIAFLLSGPLWELGVRNLTRVPGVNPVGTLVWWSLAAVLLLLIDYLIVSRVWRAVSKTVAAATPQNAGSAESTGEPSAAAGPLPGATNYGKAAFGFFLAGTLGSLLLLAVFPQPEEPKLVFGAVALVLAVALGLMSWRDRLAKVAVIGTGVVLAALLAIAAYSALIENSALRVAEQREQELMNRFRRGLPSGVHPIRADQHLVFGPVVERVIQARQTGTNMFLDLDTGRLLTPPPDVINSLTTGAGNAETFWQGLDIMENTRPARYLSWLREKGVDLMFNGKGEVIAFGGVMAAAHGTNAAGWDNWEGLTPEMAQTALAAIEKATLGISSGTTIAGQINSDSYTSAERLYSRFNGPPVNRLTREQSAMWFFKTREGGTGILQIVGFVDNPQAVRIRYKLVASAKAEAENNSAGPHSFGPVTERVLNDPDDDVHNSSLDLDTGRMFDCPIDWPLHGATNASAFDMGIRIGMAMGSVDKLLRAVRERGIDLQGDASGGSITGFDLVAEPVGNEEFDNASVTEVLNHRSHEPPEDGVTLHATNTPATWFFRTREGGAGILQITGFTTNAPRAARLRYKLVQD